MRMVAATGVDIDGVAAVCGACVAALRARGIEQWDEGYPSRAVHERDLAGGALWVVREAGTVVAALTSRTRRWSTGGTACRGPCDRRGRRRSTG